MHAILINCTNTVEEMVSKSLQPALQRFIHFEFERNLGRNKFQFNSKPPAVLKGHQLTPWQPIVIHYGRFANN